MGETEAQEDRKWLGLDPGCLPHFYTLPSPNEAQQRHGAQGGGRCVTNLGHSVISCR